MPQNSSQILLGPVATRRQRHRLHTRLALVWFGAAALGGSLLLLARIADAGVPNAVWILLGLALTAAVTVSIAVLRRTPDVRVVAREIEERHPELNALIQSAVEQEPDPATGELNFLQTRVVERAVQVLHRQAWVRRSVNALVFARAANQVGALALLAVLLALNQTEPRRSLLPTPERIVRELEVLPGDAELEKGSTLVVMARFPGDGPEEATLQVLPEKGESRRLPMNRNLDDPTYGAQIANVTEDLLYRVEFPAGTSRDFKINVFEYPRLVRGDAVLAFPDYTGLPPKTVEDTRRINAVEGTQLDYQMTLNKPVASARLWSTNGTELPLRADSASSNVLHLAMTLSDSGRYFLTLVDAAGRSNRIPDEITLAVVPNREPQLRLVSPRGDQRFSPVEEVRFETEVSDDFGLLRHGLGYSINGGEHVLIELGQESERFAKQKADHLLMLEGAGVKTDDLVSFYLWAEDFGPDGQARRVEGDIYFGDIRQLDEIFRQGQPGDSSSSSQQQQQQDSPASQLLELQKEIISATWNVKRAENPTRPSAGYEENVGVIRESQEQALAQAEAAGDRIRDARMRLHLQEAMKAMTTAGEHLATAERGPSVEPLSPALGAEQVAYQQLLRLQAREFEVTRQQRGQGQSRQNQRNQRQMNELDLEEEDQRYENERQAQTQEAAEQREDVQVLSRLKDLARRQNDLNERLKELQTELLAAETEQEKEELRRELKRLQEQQQQLLSELDELNQRMSTEQNQERMAEARQQLEQTRENMRNAAEQMQQEQTSSALASGSRAQQDLQQMSEDFRQRASGQFSEQMRELRNAARELAQNEQDLARRFQEIDSAEQKTLSDSPQRQALQDTLAQQQTQLTNVLRGVRQLAEEAEFAEPLLARQLYDTYRETGRGQQTRDALPRELQNAYDQLKDQDSTDLENTYRLASELVSKGL
ncbi:MAG TPA: hypothetical protein DCY13_07490, partial [Verrucomicrobiales bacterium]|nr:hypothetical protein [Verrucomicrobiales bacterium]